MEKKFIDQISSEKELPFFQQIAF